MRYGTGAREMPHVAPRKALRMSTTENVYGPYKHGKRWRVVLAVNHGGKRQTSYETFATENEAREFRRAVEREIAQARDVEALRARAAYFQEQADRYAAEAERNDGRGLTVTKAVIGGAGIIMFSMIFSGGLSILVHRVKLDKRNLVILAVSIGLGLGVEFRPDVLNHAPDWARTLFKQGLVVGGLAGVLLNLIIPDRSSSIPKAGRTGDT